MSQQVLYFCDLCCETCNVDNLNLYVGLFFRLYLDFYVGFVCKIIFLYLIVCQKQKIGIHF
jgi:hypothetical protein